MKLETTVTYKNFDYDIYKGQSYVHYGTVSQEFTICNGFTTRTLYLLKHPKFCYKKVISTYIQLHHSELLHGG